LKSSKDPTFRPDLYLVARIIYSLQEEGESKKTSLSVRTGLSYDRLVNYLKWMERRDLVTQDESYVRITTKGSASYDKLVAWIMEYVGKLHFPKREK
jgi:predicted transcriptional regulator